MQKRQWPAILRSPRFWIAVIGAVVVLALLHRQLDLEQLHARAAKLPGWLCIVLLVCLPLVGFPANLLHVGAGVRFGVPLGLSLVWFSILLHLLASYGLVRWKRAFFSRRFKKIRQKIPKGAHAPVTVFTMLIPGAPYFAQNYTLPLIGVPLRLYLGICFPMHAARSAVAVVLGGQSHDLTPGRVLAMLAYVVAILTASWWAMRRLKVAFADQSPAANGRKLPA
jgi:uncharacterized membrane protein YdjX (TVP38/TMEM64 family)